MTVRRHETFEDTKVSTKAVNRRITEITLAKRKKEQKHKQWKKKLYTEN